MFFEAVILGLLMGYFRGGRMLNIGNMHIKGWSLIVFAFILQILPIFFSVIPIVNESGNVISFIAMLLMCFVVMINIGKKGFWVIFIGAFLNIMAVGFNNLLMPVSLDGFTYVGLSEVVEAVKAGNVVNYISIEQMAHWSQYLGKIIALPSEYPFAKVLTLGDIVMSIGVFWFIQSEMLQPHHFKSKSTMVHYSINSKW